MNFIKTFTLLLILFTGTPGKASKLTQQHFSETKEAVQVLLNQHHEVSTERGKSVLTLLLNQFESALSRPDQNKDLLLSMLGQARAELLNQTNGFPFLYEKGDEEMKKYELVLQNQTHPLTETQKLQLKENFKFHRFFIEALF